MEGETYGGTATLTWQTTERWRLRFHYTRLELCGSNRAAETRGRSILPATAPITNSRFTASVSFATE